jgi:hypothetical protein
VKELLGQHKALRQQVPNENPCNPSIDAYIASVDSRDDLLSPSKGIVRLLLDGGLDIKEITMQEKPNGLSLSIIANENLKNISKSVSKSHFHRDVKNEYEAIVRLFDEKCGMKKK